MARLIFDAGYQTLPVQLHQLDTTVRLSAEEKFELLYKNTFRSLLAYAYTIVKNEAVAEEIVQQVFYKSWEKRNALNLDLSLTPYLYRAVHNESLNNIKHRTVRSRYEQYMQQQHTAQYVEADIRPRENELQHRLHKALNDLPERCRTIFQMSRFEGMKYNEIAEALGISPKTVENQLGKALKILRTKLSDLLPFVLFFLVNR